MWKKSNVGKSTEPWATPALAEWKIELWPSTETLINESRQKFLVWLKNWGGRPYDGCVQTAMTCASRSVKFKRFVLQMSNICVSEISPQWICSVENQPYSAQREFRRSDNYRGEICNVSFELGCNRYGFSCQKLFHYCTRLELRLGTSSYWVQFWKTLFTRNFEKCICKQTRKTRKYTAIGTRRNFGFYMNGKFKCGLRLCAVNDSLLLQIIDDFLKVSLWETFGVVWFCQVWNHCSLLRAMASGSDHYFSGW